MLHIKKILVLILFFSMWYMTVIDKFSVYGTYDFK
jgi:hypothetical protein